MAKEYIERGALMNKFLHELKVNEAAKDRKTAKAWEGACILLDIEPTADVVEVVHGEWTGCNGDNCSVCGRSPSEIMDADSYYALGFNINDLVACPFCGAKMDGKGDADNAD